MIGLGIGLLRLAPRDFWTLTPRELALALRALSGGTQPPTRDTLRALMKQFPDGGTEQAK